MGGSKRHAWVAGALLLLAVGAAIQTFMSAPAPGAGAAYQQAPDRVRAGAIVAITLRLAVWGAGGAAAGRYRDVRLLARQERVAPWVQLRPLRTSAGADGVTYRFEFVAAPGARAIDYRFTFIFDGQPKELAGMKTIEVEAPAAR